MADIAKLQYQGLEMIENHQIEVHTQGNCDIIDLTGRIHEIIGRGDVKQATVVLFNIGSTAGLTTIEFEPGLVNHDFKAAFEKIAPQNGTYQHELTWNDDNGHAHVRASLLGPSLSVPVLDGKLALGTWQQIVLIDFDTRSRDRKIICQIIT